MDPGPTDAYYGNVRWQPSSAKDLNARRELITKLYWHEDRTLPEVISLMEGQHGFKATEKQYKGAFDRWKLKKNVTHKEMGHINRIIKRRREKEDKATRFEVHDRLVPDHKIERANQGNSYDAFAKSGTYGSTAVTPEYITYDTPSVYHSMPPTPRSPQCSPSSMESLAIASPVPSDCPSTSSLEYATPAEYPCEGETSAMRFLEQDLLEDQVPEWNTFLQANPLSFLGEDEEYPAKGWWRALLEDGYTHHTSKERVVLRLSEEDLGYWSQDDYGKVECLQAWLQEHGTPGVLRTFVDLIWSVQLKALNAGQHFAFRFFSGMLKTFNSYDMNRSCGAGVDIRIEPQLPRQATPEDFAPDIQSKYSLLHLSASRNFEDRTEPCISSHTTCLTDLVSYHESGRESRQQARWLLDQGFDAQEAFKVSIIRGRIGWLGWLLRTQPSLLRRDFSQQVPEGGNYSFNWECPIHVGSCDYSALHFSIEFAAVPVTEVLLQHGAAECAERYPGSCSPLGLAIRLNRVRHVGFLLQWGVGLDVPCCGELLPLELASVLCRREIFVLLLYSVDALGSRDVLDKASFETSVLA